METFKVGDKVFAKIKDNPAWPAVIIDRTITYNVKFYGTGETGIVKSKDLFYYLNKKNTLVKSSEGTAYNEAIEEIEKAIQACGGSDGNTEDNNDTDTVEDECKFDRTENASPVATFHQIKLVTDYYLQAIIAYAEHVNKNEEVYRKKPVAKIKSFKNEVVPAKLPSGKYIGIKYNQDPLPAFDNEFEKAKYDETKAKTIVSLKSLLEDGICNPTYNPTIYEKELQLNEEEIQDRIESDLIERQKAKSRRLKTETTMMQLDRKIKKCLGLDKAEPKTALECFDIMMQLDIDPLMLKKYPQVVALSKYLRRYIGNAKEWNLTYEEHRIFQSYVGNIRERAEDLYKKFANLFNVADEMQFEDVFTAEVEEFKNQVKAMTESEVTALNSEPNSIQEFLDRLNEEEEKCKKVLN